jgi:NAD(P)-dependent dehydrogenase (short-subunit alcohol dehydrogenase family)
MGRLSGKVILITGAGSGIGRAAAVLAAQEDATVIGTDVNAVGGAETVRRAGQRMTFLEQDTSKKADWQRVLAETNSRFGKLHGLVNNAGILGPMNMSFQDEEVEDLERIFAINIEGVFLGCKLAAPMIRDSGGGSIVNLSSIAGLIGTPQLSAYGMSKGAVRQMTKSVALYCGRNGWNVRCNSVHPGIIETPMGDKLFADEAARNARLAQIPIGHFGRPEDIGWGIVFLLSDESRHMTGSELVIDGGITAA